MWRVNLNSSFAENIAWKKFENGGRLNNEEAFHKFIEMGLTLDDNVNKFMQSSMPVTGKPRVRDGSLKRIN